MARACRHTRGRPSIASRADGHIWAKRRCGLFLFGQVNDIYDFAALLNGDTFIGIHKGKGGKNGFESTAFFKLTADNLDTFKLNLKGGSDAVLYSTGTVFGGVPEPATWAMMIIGFGAVGSMVRTSRRRNAFSVA